MNCYINLLRHCPYDRLYGKCLSLTSDTIDKTRSIEHYLYRSIDRSIRIKSNFLMNKRPPLLSHSLSDNEQMLLCRRQYTTQKAATKFNELLGDICWPRMKRPQKSNVRV